MKTQLDLETEEFIRDRIRNMLSTLPFECVKGYWRIFPRSKFPNGLSGQLLRDAYELCQRTVKIHEIKKETFNDG